MIIVGKSFDKKLIALSLVLLFEVQIVFAKSIILNFTPIEITSLNHKIKNVEVIDKRLDTSQILGRIRLSETFTNHLDSLTTMNSIVTTLQDFYANINTNVDSSRIIILLHDFYIYEANVGETEKTDIFQFAAGYFIAIGENQYRLLGRVDTDISIVSFSINKELLNKNISSSLGNIFKQLYNLQQNDTTKYSYNDVIQYEENRKKSLPAYSQEIPTNGVFYNWNDFLKLDAAKHQQVVRKSNIFKIKSHKENGKASYDYSYTAKVLSIDGKSYYNLDKVFYEMYLKNGDYYFIGKINTHLNHTGIVAASMLFGMIGAVGASIIYSNTIETCEFKIEHRRGQLIPIRKISKQQLKQIKLIQN